MTQLSDQGKQKLIEKLCKSDRVKEMYDKYIIKSVPFTKWVETSVTNLLDPPRYNADEIIKLMGF